MAKEKPPITVVGDVGGRIAIIVVRRKANSPLVSPRLPRGEILTWLTWKLHLLFIERVIRLEALSDITEGRFNSRTLTLTDRTRNIYDSDGGRFRCPGLS